MILGEQIALRPIEEQDLDFLRNLANDRTVASQVVGWDFPISGADQRAWFAGLSASPHRRMMVVNQSDDTLLGLTGLWDIDWHNRSALTATKLSPDWVGRGIGTDSILTTMAWAFYDVGLRRLHTSILDFNVASMNAYTRKCGWRIEGRERESVYRAGRWCDLFQIAALDTDFVRLATAQDYVARLFPVDLDARATHHHSEEGGGSTT